MVKQLLGLHVWWSTGAYLSYGGLLAADGAPVVEELYVLFGVTAVGEQKLWSSCKGKSSCQGQECCISCCEGLKKWISYTDSNSVAAVLDRYVNDSKGGARWSNCMEL